MRCSPTRALKVFIPAAACCLLVSWLVLSRRLVLSPSPGALSLSSGVQSAQAGGVLLVTPGGQACDGPRCSYYITKALQTKLHLAQSRGWALWVVVDEATSAAVAGTGALLPTQGQAPSGAVAALLL